ncbi:hypothetical protein D4R20_00625 [bacterium]|nr:MAG: hypothetical protein D4R20_00625 [bacterium]
MKNGIIYLNQSYLTNKDIELFDLQLKSLLKEIFNPAIPFKMTDDEKRCRYCDFSAICYRD